MLLVVVLLLLLLQLLLLLLLVVVLLLLLLVVAAAVVEVVGAGAAVVVVLLLLLLLVVVMVVMGGAGAAANSFLLSSNLRCSCCSICEVSMPMASCTAFCMANPSSASNTKEALVVVLSTLELPLSWLCCMLNTTRPVSSLVHSLIESKGHSIINLSLRSFGSSTKMD
jgi:hypothetical protein